MNLNNLCIGKPRRFKAFGARSKQKGRGINGMKSNSIIVTPVVVRHGMSAEEFAFKLREHLSDSEFEELLRETNQGLGKMSLNRQQLIREVIRIFWKDWKASPLSFDEWVKAWKN